MTVRDPHLAFTAYLAPIERFTTTPPPWPRVITDLFGEPASPEVDPVAAVLHGPIARRRLAIRAGSGTVTALLVGLGDAVAVSVIARLMGEHDSPDQEARDM